MAGEEEIRKAYAAILEADFERAIDWFERAVRLEPDNADYHYRLSVTYARSNRLIKAIEHAGEAASLEPDNETYKMHADALEARRLVQEAKTHIDGNLGPHFAVGLLKRAVALDPLLLEAYLLQTVAYGALEEYALALRAASDALKLDPQHVEAGRLAGESREQLKRYLRS